MKKKKIFLGISLLAACAFAMASCNGGSAANSTTSNTADTNSTTEPGDITTPGDNTTPTENTNTGETTTTGDTVTSYSVKFLDNDGQEIKTITVNKDALISEAIAKPYVSGYKFDYWFDVETNKEFDIKTTAINSNLTLRAHYSLDTNPIAKVQTSKVEGYEESAYVTFNEYTLDSITATNYAVYLDDVELSKDNVYISKSGTTYRADLLGVKAGNHVVNVAPIIDNKVIDSAKSADQAVSVKAYDRSGYAHFNNTEGVGAYNDDGTLKDNAIVLYVTDENKNTVELTYGGITVKGIGNILNSVGQECGEAGHEGQCKKVSGTKTYYGKANTNQGILLKLAQDNIPLVVRFVGCVSNSGLYEATTFNADSTGKIEGLTAYDGVDYGGSEGDNGHMARMKSAKNITLEGVGDEATIDGWGFHLICETAYKELAKNFEVRNLRFINTPEDAIGMEGQETESTLTITASVERCWVHHNTFVSPNISSPAESDKSEGDGSCDFKRGRYFTCSYNYFENCHKTNLVGSSKTSVQYNMSYHHNIWYNCAARQPLARRGNIHFYNNLIIGTTDTVSSLRADAYMFAEGNYYLGCSRPVEYKAEGSTGTCKSYNNNIIGCFNAYDATEVTDREATVASNCKDNATNTSYANFDTNKDIFYYDSSNKKSDCYLTDPNQARLDCLAQSGSRYRTVLGNAILSTSSDLVSTAASDTISGTGSLTIAKGKGVLKVFTVTAPVTVNIAATASAGFDTGYLVKRDGTVVLELSADVQSAVLMPGDYVILSCIAFTGNNGKNDKETIVTTCTFEPYDSAELNAQLIAQYNAAHDAIPATIEYSDSHYQLIKAAMTAYKNLGDLQSQITNYTDVTNALASYKTLGEAYVEGLIGQIELPVTASNSSPIITARSAYNALLAKINDASVSNYDKLQEAESQMSALAVDIFLAQANQIPATITYTSECDTLITNAEVAYASLDESQVKQDSVKTAYAKVVSARETYNNLEVVGEVDALIASTELTASKAELKAVMDAYNALTAAQKDLIQNTSKYDSISAKYVDTLIGEIPATITFSNMAVVSQARAAYNALTTTQQALVTNYAKLEAAEDEVAGLGVETLSTYTTTDFSTWDISGDGAVVSSNSGLNVKVMTGKSVVVVSKFMMTSVSNVTLNVSTQEKGNTDFNVYTSSDGTTWTKVATLKSKDNKSANDQTAELNVTSPVYIKLEITCSKSSEKTASINSIVINKQ